MALGRGGARGGREGGDDPVLSESGVELGVLVVVDGGHLCGLGGVRVSSKAGGLSC